MEMKFHLLLLFFLLHLSSASSSSSLLGREKNLPSGVGMAGSAGADDDDKNKMALGSNISRISLSNFKGSTAGESGYHGGSASNGEHGEHQSPNGQGGSAVIPIYGAGAANLHRGHHHGTAGRNRICIGLSLSSTALALAVIQLYI
ncbi:hypothetical protein SLEP1_g5399 [Rubroshorea leprosula]|uniref:Uncharacterized protein n=1 Tax=Rubroshorea leprosula TaxID=152421 RepID=A0AAV5HRT7_9ROSI|nr:hypothetical protein SLEP1_g5399 [Rubroshorea leprosula]